MKRFALLIVATTLVFAFACSSEPVQEDIGNPVDTIQADTADIGSGDVADVSVVDSNTPDITADEGDTNVPFENGAKALISASDDQLIGGPMKAGVVGDIVISNKNVRFVVRNQAHSLYSPYSGALVDADIVRAEGDNKHDKFFETFLMSGFARIFKPASMEIVDDGAYSGTAIVRFKGTDGGMALIDSMIPTFPLGLDVTTDYILTPDAKFIEIKTTIKDPNNLGVPVDVGQFLQFGNRTTAFFDRCGTDQDCLRGKKNVRWLASAAGDVSYGVTVPGTDNVELLLAQNELMILKGGSFEIPAGSEITTHQYVAVADGTIDGVRQIMNGIRGEPEGAEVTVNVTISDDYSSMDKVWIQAKLTAESSTTGWVSASSPDSEGKAIFHLEPGTYDFVISVPGAPDYTATDVVITADGENIVPISTYAAGWLHVTVKDAADNPVTAALSLQAGNDAVWTAGVSKFDVIRNGDWTIPVVAGNYTATVAKGLVWSIDRQNITVLAGETTELTATIHEAVSTTGAIMLNTHEHCERSIDSAVPAEDRVYNAIANGVELMNPTDHDYFGTHEQTIAELGLTDKVKSNLSYEVSPGWGHTTAANCSTPPAYPMYFAINYTLYNEMGGVDRGMTPVEVYTQARDDFGCQFLAVNHPYRGGPTFETYAITATSNPEDAKPDLDLHMVDAVEVYNKNDSQDNIINENLPAWFNLLNRGYIIAAIGGSDEHGFSGNYGNPRNMVMSSTDLPGDIDKTEIFNHIKAFESQVVGGPVITITVEGLGMGQVLPADGTSVEVRLIVEAPEWMGLNFTKVVMNGEVVKEFTPVINGAVLRVDESFTVELTSDAWIVAYAGSNLPEHQMIPVSSKQPFSVTNPVFIDADGLGYEAIYAAGAPWD
jgi:hypothetical protein